MDNHRAVSRTVHGYTIAGDDASAAYNGLRLIGQSAVIQRRLGKTSLPPNGRVVRSAEALGALRRQQQPAGGLETALHFVEESSCSGAVHQAMVVGQTERHH